MGGTVSPRRLRAAAKTSRITAIPLVHLPVPCCLEALLEALHITVRGQGTLTAPLQAATTMPDAYLEQLPHYLVGITFISSIICAYFRNWKLLASTFISAAICQF